MEPAVRVAESVNCPRSESTRTPVPGTHLWEMWLSRLRSAGKPQLMHMHLEDTCVENPFASAESDFLNHAVARTSM